MQQFLVVMLAKRRAMHAYRRAWRDVAELGQIALKARQRLRAVSTTCAQILVVVTDLVAVGGDIGNGSSWKLSRRSHAEIIRAPNPGRTLQPRQCTRLRRATVDIMAQNYPLLLIFSL
ncbi:hypothetical protein D3C85_1573110 [compost metagenome]